MLFSRANFGTLSTGFAIQACGAATGILTARLLGPVARGELATVILWPTILSNLGLLGCNWVLAREVAKDREREADWASAGVCLGLTTALLFFLAGYVSMPLLLSDRSYLLPLARLCLLLIPLDICNQILLAVEHGRMRWRHYNVLRLSFFLFYLLLILPIRFARTAQIGWFVGAFLASHLLTLLTRLWTHRRTLATGNVRFGRCRHLLRAGLPYFGATVSNLISLQLDTVLVVSLLSTPAAGIYAVAGTFANGQASLGDALGITSFGVVSNESDSANQARIITEMFRQSALLSVGLGLLLVCLIPFSVKPLFGVAFSAAVGPAVVLVLAASWTSSTNILNQGLRGAGRPHAGLVSQLVGSGVLAVAAMLFWGAFGLMGIAWAVMLSSCAQALILIAAAANWLRISPLRFWPFAGSDIRLFFQQLAAVRLRFSRTAA